MDEDDPAVDPAVDEDFLIMVMLCSTCYFCTVLRVYLERACNAAEGQPDLKPQRRKNANDAIIEFVPAQKSAVNYELSTNPTKRRRTH